MVDQNGEEITLFCEAKLKKGVNLLDQKRYAEAKAVYDELNARYPNSYYGAVAAKNSADIRAAYLD